MLTREKRLTIKRTARSLETKRKARLRARGMFPQLKHLDHSLWQRVAMREALRRPLRGIKASAPEVKPPQMRKGPQPLVKPKRGILARIFRRPGA
jgi:hypothetical protein